MQKDEDIFENQTNALIDRFNQLRKMQRVRADIVCNGPYDKIRSIVKNLNNPCKDGWLEKAAHDKPSSLELF